MKYRTLGRTGLSCSEIGLGTWALAASAYGDVSRSEAHATVRAALDAGVNLFDTAPLYGVGKRDGVAEEILGQALGADRSRVLVATKFGRNPSDDYRPAFHAERARTSVEESLRRLGTDYIDLLFFHSPFSPDEISDNVWDALGRLREEGKVRFLGHSISAFQATEAMARNWAAERKIEAVQAVYSLLNREASVLIRDLADQQIGVVAREVLANGFLSGSVRQDTVFPPDSVNARYSREEISERVDQVERFRFLTRDGACTLPKAAFRWVLDNPAVSVALSGAKTPAELLDTISASEAPAYSADELIRAEEVHHRNFAAA